ncbi:MAG: RNA polymerase sigma-70 factor (ECF subfamily) [Lentisphaeria bacterium]|jgi:RNA polymerase sigma-70 factor (ECF subfamily)
MLLTPERIAKRDKPAYDDDAALVARAIKELPYVTQSYELLMKRHYALIYRTCLGILRDTSEAEDVSQIVLLKVFNGLPRFQERSAFKTWLIKIVTNVCFSRHQKLKLQRERYADFSEGSVDDRAGHNNETAETLWRDDFDTMVGCLDEQEQYILSLRFVSELSLAEIAVIMELGLSATKMRFYRALEKLKEQM